MADDDGIDTNNEDEGGDCDCECMCVSLPAAVGNVEVCPFPFDTWSVLVNNRRCIIFPVRFLIEM